jgi:hypothetical protein
VTKNGRARFIIRKKDPENHQSFQDLLLPFHYKAYAVAVFSIANLPR